MSRLGDALDKGTQAAPSVSRRLQAALASARVMKPITIPGLNITALLTLVGTERLVDLEGEVVSAMEKRNLSLDVVNVAVWELERARHVLAEAVLDDDLKVRSNPPPIGSLADWGKVSKEIIAWLWNEYSELSEEHDPFAVALTDSERAELAEALSKKNAPLLRSFGARRLAAWLTTSDVQLASSPTGTSSPGEPSPASSS